MSLHVCIRSYPVNSHCHDLALLLKLLYFCRSFHCIPLLREKPCLYVWNYFEDHTFRYHNCNWLSKMANRLACSLLYTL